MGSCYSKNIYTNKYKILNNVVEEDTEILRETLKTDILSLSTHKKELQLQIEELNKKLDNDEKLVHQLFKFEYLTNKNYYFYKKILHRSDYKDPIETLNENINKGWIVMSIHMNIGSSYDLENYISDKERVWTSYLTVEYLIPKNIIKINNKKQYLSMKCKIEKLEKENKILANHHEFKPMGQGYLNTKEHYENIIQS